MVFSLKHQPGALFEALRVFADRNINLLKLESRPWSGKMWEYLFYIDFEGSIKEQKVAEALEELQTRALLFRVLGSYPRSHVQMGIS